MTQGGLTYTDRPPDPACNGARNDTHEPRLIGSGKWMSNVVNGGSSSALIGTTGETVRELCGAIVQVEGDKIS